MQYTLSTAVECIEANLKRGKITKEEAKELLRLVRLKYTQLNFVEQEGVRNVATNRDSPKKQDGSNFL